MSKKSKIIIYVLLTLVAIYFVFPFIYMFFSAFKTEAEGVAYPPNCFPENLNLGNFIDAWKAQPFGKFFLNSLTVTVLSAVGSMASAAVVAYGFARYNFNKI